MKSVENKREHKDYGGNFAEMLWNYYCKEFYWDITVKDEMDLIPMEEELIPTYHDVESPM